jgi:hypothetical protein
MHKRTIRLAISAIMLALFVSVPVDAAGQGRAGLRQRQQQQRERAPRASTPRTRSAPRRAVPRASTPRARPAPRDSDRRGSFRRGFGQRGFGQFGFGRRGGFRYTQPRFNFNFGLGTSQYGYTPQYYPPYSWDRMPYNSGCRWWDEPSYSVVYRGGRYVREYFCVNMEARNRY